MSNIALEQPNMETSSALDSHLIATQIDLLTWTFLIALQGALLQSSELDRFKWKGRDCAGQGPPAGGGYQRNTSHPQALSTSSTAAARSQKRRTYENGNRHRRGSESDEEDDDPHKPQQKTPDPHNDSKPAQEQVLCPFYLVDQWKHQECSLLVLKDWKGLREHILDRKHVMGDQCAICGKIFRGQFFEQEWATHTRLRTCSETPNRPCFVGVTRDQDRDIRLLTKRGARVTLNEIWPKLWEIIHKDLPYQPYNVQPLEQQHTYDTPRAMRALLTDPTLLDTISHIKGMEHVPQADRIWLATNSYKVIKHGLERQGYNMSPHDQTPDHGAALDNDDVLPSHSNVSSTYHTTGTQVSQNLNAPPNLPLYPLSPTIDIPPTNANSWQADQSAAEVSVFGEVETDGPANDYSDRSAIPIEALPALFPGNWDWNNVVQPGALIESHLHSPQGTDPCHMDCNYGAGQDQVLYNPVLFQHAGFGLNSSIYMPFNSMASRSEAPAFVAPMPGARSPFNHLSTTIPQSFLASTHTQHQLGDGVMEVDDHRDSTSLDKTNESNAFMPCRSHWDLHEDSSGWNERQE